LISAQKCNLIVHRFHLFPSFLLEMPTPESGSPLSFSHIIPHSNLHHLHHLEYSEKIPKYTNPKKKKPLRISYTLYLHPSLIFCMSMAISTPINYKTNQETRSFGKYAKEYQQPKQQGEQKYIRNKR
jgi:hypothetical protein